MLSLSRIRLAIAVAMTLAVPVCLFGQNVKPELKGGIIIGTAIDANGDPVPSATVELKDLDSGDRRTVTTPDSGSFEFRDVQPGVPYQITITAQDFADWHSSSIALEPGQFKIVTGIQLQIHTEVTQVQVTYDPVQVATEQLKAEEHQRVFGIVPNFYISYEENPAPLTAKMKFQLALKVSTDPVTAAGVLAVAGFRHAGDSLDYGQGWDAYGKRLGATAANNFSNIMLRAQSPKAVIVDLTDVSYIDSSGIATLIEGLRMARSRQTTLCLQGLHGRLLQLFQVTGMSALFEKSGCGSASSMSKVS